MVDKFKDYTNIEKLLEETKIPKMFKVRQKFSREKIQDVAAETKKQLEEADIKNLIKKGMSIAVTGSSRGIANMNIVLRETVAFLKENGAEPFIIPAMGSHGGSTAQGQKEILSAYGITEEFCGCPIKSSMETVQIGSVYEGEKGSSCIYGQVCI